MGSTLQSGADGGRNPQHLQCGFCGEELFAAVLHVARSVTWCDSRRQLFAAVDDGLRPPLRQLFAVGRGAAAQPDADLRWCTERSADRYRQLHLRGSCY